MSDETGYQGWKNYETWAVALWLDNEEGSYLYCHESAELALRDEAANYDVAAFVERENREECRRAATSSLAARLKDEHDEGATDLLDGVNGDRPASVYNDLLRGALSDVDWYEVAAHYIDEHVDEVFAELTS